jgi:spermidine/putrescine transport system permease protein
VAGDEWPTGAAFATIMFLAALVLTGAFQALMKSLRRGDVR